MNRPPARLLPGYQDPAVVASNGSQTSPTTERRRGAPRKPEGAQRRTLEGYGFCRSDPGRFCVPSSHLPSGMTSTGSPSFRSCAPTAITFSPTCTPSTAIELSLVAPNCTSRRLAVHLPPRSCATITAKQPGFEGHGTMALSGTAAADVREILPKLSEAIMPGFKRAPRLATVTSIVKTRFRESALGEMLVTRPTNGVTSSCRAMPNCCPRCTRP